jgi:hypothetical protein
MPKILARLGVHNAIWAVMKGIEKSRREKFLTRAMNAEQQAARSTESVEKTMWEEIAQCWRELARRTAPNPGA